MPRRTLSVVVKLFLASLAVGLAMTYFDLSPGDLLEGARTTAVKAFNWGESFVGWAWAYVLVGAVVVVPIWLLRLWLGRRRS